MPLCKLTTTRHFGDMTKEYTIQVAFAATPTQNAQDVEKEIAKFGFNILVESYKSPGYNKVEKIS